MPEMIPRFYFKSALTMILTDTGITLTLFPLPTVALQCVITIILSISYY